MDHPVYRVVDFEIMGPYRLRVVFDDRTQRETDFRGVLKGELYGPFHDESLFRQVSIDAEVHTLVWPNGADFDPATLHDWPKYEKEMKDMAARWAEAKARTG